MATPLALPVIRDFALDAGSKSLVVIGIIPSPDSSSLWMATPLALPVVRDFALDAGSKSLVVIGIMPSPDRSFLGAAASDALADDATEAATAAKETRNRAAATVLLWAIVIW
jgi:hypothetical protein